MTAPSNPRAARPASVDATAAEPPAAGFAPAPANGGPQGGAGSAGKPPAPTGARPSSRHLVPIALLLLVTAAAVGWLARQPRHLDPCLHPDRLAHVGEIPQSTATTGGGPDWQGDRLLRVAGRFPNPLSADHPFDFQVVRSYNLLHQGARPVGLVMPNVDAEHHKVVPIDVDGTVVPIHVVDDYTKNPHQLFGYFHVYGVDPVESPMFAQLGKFQEVLRRGTPALTTVIASGPISRRGRDVAEEAMVAWLANGWRFVRGACVASSE